MTGEVTLTDCTRPTTCFDCNNEACLLHGRKMADCPKYHCDNSVPLDCDHCTFVDQHIRETRALYKREAELNERTGSGSDARTDPRS